MVVVRFHLIGLLIEDGKLKIFFLHVFITKHSREDAFSIFYLKLKLDVAQLVRAAALYAVR